MIISDSKEDSSPIIDRLHPALATIKERRLLTKAGSTKQTFHISLDLAQAPVRFKVGDSIGIYAQNDPALVHRLIKAMHAKAEEIIIDPRSKKTFSLSDFLSYKANLSRSTTSFLKLLYENEKDHDQKNRLHHLLQGDKTFLTQYLSTHEPLDLLREYPNSNLPLQILCEQFGPMLPRFYSVASSQATFKEEVHLTVALFSFHHRDEMRFGVGSHFLCHLAKVKETPIPIYVQPAHHFTLPDSDAPIIMIGPGTGIAPFRAFMQERIATGARGKNWLFFGERNRASDYFYEEEWEDLIQQDKLKLDLAFSRDQREKIYVQHRMYANARELWEWLENGAYFYVCGDAHKMAKDVEHMLQKIVSEQGQMNEEAAKAYVKTLRTQKRYLADVY